MASGCIGMIHVMTTITKAWTNDSMGEKEKLAQGESGCDAHLEPEVEQAEGGTLFRAHGENAFLFAQLFLALEAGEA